MNEPNQREKRHAALYFSPKNSEAYKELAARVRSDGGKTTLVWSNRWRGAESILTECRAIIVEEGCENADDIVEAYRRYAVNCEIHFADAKGEFPDDDAPPANDTFIEPDDTTDQNGDGSVDDEDEAIEEEHTDPDAETDSAVEEAEERSDTDSGDSDGDGEDAGTADEGGEAGTEDASDPGESSIN